jgi:hypothetical protein
MNTFWDFNIGNAITIAGGLIATAMVWQKLKDRLDVTAEQTNQNRIQLDEIAKMAIATSIQQHERRITSMEDTMRGLALSLEGMKSDLMWIKETLRRQDRSADQSERARNDE